MELLKYKLKSEIALILESDDYSLESIYLAIDKIFDKESKPKETKDIKPKPKKK